MSPIWKYPEALEKWTWRRQVMDDGMTKILSKLRVQGHADCAYFGTVTTLEPNLKVQCQRSVSLSIRHLKRLDQISRTRPSAGKIWRLLSLIQDIGILEEGQYTDILGGTLEETQATRYKITKIYHYEMHKLDHIEHALYRLRDGGPLLAVINISANYNECKDSGMIYRFDPARIVKDENGVPETHAVCVVSFAVEAKVPCFECQDSQGQHFGRNGFLMVDITSVIELYSIKI
ncbi:unnamed protein product [Urochloa decumbens]|uniref:Peptidase C1A papain C-terminal domain-containing protein n=1 Tax=Urochloa decumbens TaxID=240449 RepID=A0ABC9EPC9_9POAL